jgi:hypothetical protein
MRLRARTDGNHAEFGKSMRACGWLMYDMSRVGQGFPDWLGCAPDGSVWLIELKDPSKPPSARSLTEDQQKWHQAWRRCATLLVVTSAQEVIEAWQRMRK